MSPPTSALPRRTRVCDAATQHNRPPRTKTHRSALSSHPSAMCSDTSAKSENRRFQLMGWSASGGRPGGLSGCGTSLVPLLLSRDEGTAISRSSSADSVVPHDRVAGEPSVAASARPDVVREQCTHPIARSLSLSRHTRK